jgi:CheY-like chemotaxis protein
MKKIVCCITFYHYFCGKVQIFLEMKKILIAEDTDSNYLLLSIILRKDYELSRATTGKEVLALFAEERPDLILMDIKMPEMDGLEATRIIRRTDVDLPIIALTANAYDSDREKALYAGCNSYMAKPVNAAKLREMLAAFLGQ